MQKYARDVAWNNYGCLWHLARRERGLKDKKIKSAGVMNLREAAFKECKCRGRQKWSIDLVYKVNAWFQFAGFRGRPILGQRKKLTVPSASNRPLRLYIPAVTKAASLFRSWRSKANANWRSPSINRVLLKNLKANTKLKGKSPTINQVLLSKVGTILP